MTTTDDGYINPDDVDPEMLGAGWVRHQGERPKGHECKPPLAERVWSLPSGLTMATGGNATHRETVPDGALGDLWRCYCGKLWRIGQSCDDCDLWSVTDGRCPRGGYHAGGLRWRPARFWQRVRHWRFGL